MNMKLSANVENDIWSVVRPKPRVNPADRLFFSQVREDPRLEIDALGDLGQKHFVVVSSGGCTALSLLCMGAHVAAVDLNSAQNNLTELKYRALRHLPHDDALRFLGALPASGNFRIRMWNSLADQVSPSCRDYWDERVREIGKGVLGVGVTERCIKVLMAFVARFIHSPKKLDQLLKLSSIIEQEEFYDRHWNNKRWRLLFDFLLNRFAWTRAYSKEFFQNVGNTSFSQLFFKLFEHGLTELPVQDNYFLHYIVKGFYSKNSLPFYLQPQYRAKYQERIERLSIQDASMQQHLESCADDTLDGVVLSNICEWMSQADVEELFKLCVKKIKPGGRLIFRNFVGYTVIPLSLEGTLIMQGSYSRELIRRDRSLSQYRIVICDVNK